METSQNNNMWVPTTGMPTLQHVCPNCGYCPCCGRSLQTYPYVWSQPTMPRPVLITNSTLGNYV
jgi:hypothetical protein